MVSVVLPQKVTYLLRILHQAGEGAHPKYKKPPHHFPAALQSEDPSIRKIQRGARPLSWRFVTRPSYTGQ